MDCPHCGGVIGSGALKPLLHEAFDDAMHCIVVDGQRRRVTGARWALLQLLRQRPRRFVRIDFLTSVTERAAGDGGDVDSLRIYIVHLRRALKGSPFGIATLRGVGYGLFFVSDIRQCGWRDGIRHLATERSSQWPQAT
jgi:DNA-binding winged helix-turn-helix (wHTH) protein